MKKIIIYGGEFYKLNKVHTSEGNYQAGVQNLLTTLGSNKLYLIEVNKNINYDLYAQSTATYLLNKSYNEINYVQGYNSYTVRLETESPVFIRFGVDMQDTVINIYEVVKYGNYKLTSTITGINSMYGGDQCAKYLVPDFVNGKTYKMEVETLYTGQITFYNSDNTVLYDGNCVLNTKKEIQFTALSNGITAIPRFRTYEVDKSILCKINEVT